MITNSLAGQRHRLAWHPESCAWCASARGPRIETGENIHLLCPNLAEGEKRKSVRVMYVAGLVFALFDQNSAHKLNGTDECVYLQIYVSTLKHDFDLDFHE